MTKKFGLAATAVMLSLSLGLISNSPAAARELSIAIPHANLKSFTSQAECVGKYGASKGCNNVLGEACANSFEGEIWATKLQFDMVYDAIVNKGATVKFTLLNDGSEGKIPGSFGPVVCELAKK